MTTQQVNKKCKFCKVKFTVALRRKETANFCSTNCHDEYRRGKPAATRLNPKIERAVVKDYKSRKYTNEAILKKFGIGKTTLARIIKRNNLKLKQPQGLNLTKSCSQCKKQFSRPPYLMKLQKFCSPECHDASRRDKSAYHDIDDWLHDQDMPLMEYVKDELEYRSISKIAEELRLPIPTLYRWCKQCKIEIPKHPLSKRSRKKISKFMTKLRKEQMLSELQDWEKRLGEPVDQFLRRELEKNALNDIYKKLGGGKKKIRRWCKFLGITIMSNKERMRTEEHSKKMSKIQKQSFRNGRVSPMKGKKHSAESIRKMSEANSGKNNPRYVHGMGRQPYPLEFAPLFKSQIRARDNHTCQLCGDTEPLKGLPSKILDVHHINYYTYDLRGENLISLCRGCNSKVNYDRSYYFAYFCHLKGIATDIVACEPRVIPPVFRKVSDFLSA